jgi:putative MATE family efflux protein
LLKQEFYNKFIKIIIPILIQNIIVAIANFLNFLMIGQLGTSEIAAVGIVSQLFFIIILVNIGIGNSASVFTAQLWGKRNIQEIQSTFGMTLLVNIIINLVFSIIIFVFPYFILGLFTSDKTVLEIGSTYMRLIAVVQIPYGICFLASYILRSVEEVKLPMFASSIGLCLNIILNSLLIFGILGFPKLGVIGAAYATIIARVIEFSIIIIVSYIKKNVLAVHIKVLYSFTKIQFIKFAKIASPLLFQNLFWVIGTTVYQIVFARISTDSVAAFNIAASIENICLMVFNSIAIASGIMIGNRIGAGEKEKGIQYSVKLLIITTFVALLFGILLIIFRGYIVSLYHITDSVKNFLLNLILIISLILWSKSINIIYYTGILRSGGDTKFSMFADIGGIWLIGIPMALITAFYFHLPIYYVAAGIALEEIFKVIIGSIRFKSRKWIVDFVK